MILGLIFPPGMDIYTHFTSFLLWRLPYPDTADQQRGQHGGEGAEVVQHLGEVRVPGMEYCTYYTLYNCTYCTLYILFILYILYTVHTWRGTQWTTPRRWWPWRSRTANSGTCCSYSELSPWTRWASRGWRGDWGQRRGHWQAPVSSTVHTVHCTLYIPASLTLGGRATSRGTAAPGRASSPSRPQSPTCSYTCHRNTLNTRRANFPQIIIWWGAV